MATYVYLDNYRGFKQALIPVHQVNFLVGENSTGKSSFLDVINTLTEQSFWHFDASFGTELPGQEKHFDDLVSARGETRLSFTIGAMHVGANNSKRDSGMLVTYISRQGRPAAQRISTWRGSIVGTVVGDFQTIDAPLTSRQNKWDSLDEHGRLTAFVEIHSSDAGLVPLAGKGGPGMPLVFRFANTLFDENEIASTNPIIPAMFRRQLSSLAPIRSKPRRTYDAAQTPVTREGDHIPYVIRRRLGTEENDQRFTDFLVRIGKESGLFESIQVKSYGEDPRAPFELKVVLDELPLALENVGYGVSQALPILVEMFLRNKETAFTIQQPEVHLHPRAQAAVGDLIATLARNDKKVFFVETHSDFTIDRFRRNVRDYGRLLSQLLFFERAAQGNRVAAIGIGPNGELDPAQPNAYREFFLRESLSFL